MNAPLIDIINRYGLSAKKSLGQHFLLDEGITGRIARYAGNLKHCNVIEIGPGPGGLTRSLLASGAKMLFVVEKDERCIAIMNELKESAQGRLEIIHGDALEADLIKLVPAPRKIVANLPYNIGTELLLKWLGEIYETTGSEAPYESLTLMFQKEVAERIAAIHGNKDYGRLSIISQWLCETRIDMELPPGAFSPPPKVSSMVVTLTPRPQPLIDVKKESLEKVMAAAFGQRRKMLRVALKSLGINTEALFLKSGIDPTRRAEEIDIKTLCKLAKDYQELAHATNITGKNK